MKKLVASLCLFNFVFMYSQTKPQYPATPANPVTDELHGTKLTDNYRWLENGKDPKVVEWTKKQHEFTIDYLSKTQKQHPDIRKSLESYLDMDYEGPINKVGKAAFQSVKKKGDKQGKLFSLVAGKKTLIWDPVKIDPSGNTSTSGIQYTYDGSLAAISSQTSGGEISTVYFIDTKTGKQVHPPLPNVFGFSFTKSQSEGYVTIRTKKDIDGQLPLKTYRWKLGEPFTKALEIGTTKDAKNSFFIYDNRYADVTFFGESDFYANSLKLKKTGTSEPGVEIYKSDAYNVYPYAQGDKFYALTNDNAPNYRLIMGQVNNPSYSNWKDLIPEDKNVKQDYAITNTHIIIQEKKDIVSRLVLYSLDGAMEKELELPEKGSVASMSYDREEDSIFVTLNTFTSTSKTYIASAKDFKWRLFYQRQLPVDMSNIVGEIKFFNSKDGTHVPMFVLHRKDVKLDGNNPTLLTAYGGFNSGIDVHYYGFYSQFINAGGVMVEAGIRGGDEYGEAWHRDGMLLKKQNCFDDFNTCAEWLIQNKYTNANKLVAMGGSNGGLLMGAVATQRPELYKAIVCQVPLLDMIRYHQFLIARYWIPEYGSSENADDFKNLLSYSPYQNIKKEVSLPNMLVTTGTNESRVDPLHAKKFVAALQNNPAQKNPVLLYVDYNSGHGSGQNTKQTIDNWTFTFEYIMNQLGM
jgi:prolyl oligopeptidase